MSTAETNEKALGQEVDRRGKLDAMKAWLVKLGDELAQKAPPNFKTQLSLAQEVAARESVPEVIVNFLAYQAARASQNEPGWRHNDLYRMAEKHLGEIATQAGDDPNLRQRAIAHYFGYARRSYMAGQLLRSGGNR